MIYISQNGGVELRLCAAVFYAHVLYRVSEAVEIFGEFLYDKGKERRG